ncbi:MAG: M23 family metallopeptidase [Nitrospira sp.]|nr:M23 family metallopeptidase [Candidatus Manganitrophaceae bacterium]HIL34648.1 M23 family metallopeptidase [Candidatus Manganitrophaceae bacterium]
MGGETESVLQVAQGNIILFSIGKIQEVDSVSGRFLDKPVPFFKKASGDYAALIGIDLAQPTGRYPLTVTWKKGNSDHQQRVMVEVKAAVFGIQHLKLPKKMVDLDPETLKRVRQDKKKVIKAFRRSLGEKLWEGEFVVPAKGRRQGTFGRRRFLNGKPRKPHTGEDISAPMGTPVLATNKGKVVLVGNFFFNGRSVFIDHGLGLFSMYFHLSEVSAKEGSTIHTGEEIGRVGKSGRVTGPHLHWGMRLNGARIDPFSLIGKKVK